MNPTVAQLAQNIKQGGGFIPSWYSPQVRKPDPFGGSMVEHALGNMPFSRVTSTGRQVFDPRKPILQKLAGLGIGAGMTTVSPYQQRRARQEALNQLMKATDFANEFSQVYMDKEKLLKRRQDARIPAGGELSSLPGEFSFPAMLMAEQRRLNRAGKDAKAAARERKEQKFSDYYQS